MANQKYDQVIDLMAEGKLRWQTDNILAVLLQGAAFDPADTVLSQVGGSQFVAPIQGRVVATGGNLLGHPAFFADVPPDTEFQLVVVQNTGDGDPKTLAWYDTDDNDGPLMLENGGTLVVRPALLSDETPTDLMQSNAPRLWMKV